MKDTETNVDLLFRRKQPRKPVGGYSSAGVKLVLGRGESGYVPHMLDFYPR